MFNAMQTAQTELDTIRISTRDTRAIQGFEFVRTHNFIQTVDGDEVFVEVTSTDFEEIYAIGPTLYKPTAQINATSYRDAIEILAQFLILRES